MQNAINLVQSSESSGTSRDVLDTAFQQVISCHYKPHEWSVQYTSHSCYFSCTATKWSSAWLNVFSWI